MKLSRAKGALKNAVEELPSPPGRNVEKFSVVVDNCVEYLHLFQSKENNGEILCSE